MWWVGGCRIILSRARSVIFGWSAVLRMEGLDLYLPNALQPYARRFRIGSLLLFERGRLSCLGTLSARVLIIQLVDELFVGEHGAEPGLVFGVAAQEHRVGVDGIHATPLLPLLPALSLLLVLLTTLSLLPVLPLLSLITAATATVLTGSGGTSGDNSRELADSLIQRIGLRLNTCILIDEVAIVK